MFSFGFLNIKELRIAKDELPFWCGLATLEIDSSDTLEICNLKKYFGREILLLAFV